MIYFQKLAHRILLISILGAQTFVVSGCQTPSDELRVLEKSRQIEPVWLSQGVGLRQSKDGIDYVICKEKVLDLPLGLTQTESSVLYNLKFHMFELIMSHVDTSSLNAESRRDLNKHLSQILDAELNKSNLKDFYFDKISVPQAENELIPEYYRIYALAHVGPKQRADITDRIRKYIQSSSHAALRSQLDTFTRF